MLVYASVPLMIYVHGRRCKMRSRKCWESFWVWLLLRAPARSPARRPPAAGRPVDIFYSTFGHS